MLPFDKIVWYFSIPKPLIMVCPPPLRTNWCFTNALYFRIEFCASLWVCFQIIFLVSIKNEGPTENRLGELGSLYKYYYYYHKKCLGNSLSNIAFNSPSSREKSLHPPPSKRVVSLGLHGLLAMRGERRSRALRAKCRVRLVAWLIKRPLCRLRNLLKHVKRTWRKQKIRQMFLWIVCWK